jgi:hypothetical protein
MEEQAREGLIDGVGCSLVPFYHLMGTLGNFYSAGTLCMEHGTNDRVSDSTCMHHLQSYCGGMGLWLLGTFWSLPFQLIISPIRWASEASIEVADRVAVNMESQAHMDKSKRRMSCYLDSMLSEMRGGHRARLMSHA